jgi:SLT domain-containing protein
VVGFCLASIPQAVPLQLTPEQQAQVFPKVYAESLVMHHWQSQQEFVCLVELWDRESHWNPKAHNKRSGAYGIAQFMPQTWGNYKFPYKPKAASIQITAGLRYITKRYGSPCQAWKVWQIHAKRGNPWY